MKLFYRPRWLNLFYASVFGYFWLPCPLCGRNFGGHECGAASIPTSPFEGKCVCPKCEVEADRITRERYEAWEADGMLGGATFSLKELDKEKEGAGR